MPKMTLSVPNELLTKFKEIFPEINVAEVARRVISDKVLELSKLEQLKDKGEI